MAVPLTVRQVREALYRHDGGREGAGNGQPSNHLLGTLFHEVFADLVGENADINWQAALETESRDSGQWREPLVHHAYRKLVGPRLTRHHATLQPASEAVCVFWEAVVNLCDWIAELLATVQTARGELPAPGTLVQTEQTLRIEVRQPDWSDSVLLTGCADAVWRPPSADTWCVAELKLGRGHEQADLGQACLYHWMLREALMTSASSADSDLEAPPHPGPLAIVTFKPQREERLFPGDLLDTAQARLLDLIGRLAGVVASPTGTDAGTETGTDAGINDGLSSGDDSLTPGSRASGFSRFQPTSPPAQQHLDLGAALVETLREYDAAVEMSEPPVLGPAFIRFPVRPARGVRIRKIEGLADEIKVRLGLEQPPFISSESGQLAVDIQRMDRRTVLFSDVREQLPSITIEGCSRLAVGVDLTGRLRFADLAQPEHCHLLVAGTTGSGKSEWLRAAIGGLIYCNTAETLRLVLIDPKRNAFNELAGSPMLFEGIVYPDEQDPVEVLERLAAEMDRRYAVMDGADTIDQHAERSGAALPRIVCVCDEYFDLVNRGRRQRAALEEQIFRLGAKARAAGIHLILATQQPSREVIRGALDANIPARVALKTSKEIESRMLLGEEGAARLLGQGDLLFKDIGPARRLQGVYLPLEERSVVYAGPVGPEENTDNGGFAPSRTR